MNFVTLKGSSCFVWLSGKTNNKECVSCVKMEREQQYTREYIDSLEEETEREKGRERRGDRKRRGESE